ncbi:FAD-dependent oxidoreductase [Candidatus Pacearchaeota archaeon]|nr:FAD-dependent oxidoreductase [Candidatus Pacearchaeota archaeon]
MAKKVVIFGAGPAGLAAAYTLAENTKPGELEITLIDQGKRVEQRQRASDFDRACGVGGVGAYSDGKFIFDTIVGKRQIGTNLGELIGERDRDYMIAAKEIFRRFFEPIHGPIKEISQERLREAERIAALAGRNDMDYIVAHDYHIGTDRLPELIGAIQEELEAKGVKIVTGERVTDFEKGKVYTQNEQGSQEYQADYILVAPGRDGSAWLQETLKKRGVKHTTRAIDVGLRIETDSAVLKHLTDIERDVKLEFRHPNGDLIRTFCVCPYGEVAQEGKDKRPEMGGLDFCLVNGASSSTRLSNNTNFALLVRMPLRGDGDNAAWGREIARTYKEAGINKIVLQRMADLKSERSSKPGKVLEWRVKPTLPEEFYFPGDVRIGMPARIMDDLRYGIERLSVPGLMEGLNQDSTLLYGPEIKMHGIKVATDDYLESESMPGLFLAGDGTGFSRGIGGAMASGIRAAEGILRYCKKS